MTDLTAIEARIEARYTDKTPAKGDWVVVYKGRKVPKGTEGTVIWTGDKGWGLRVGIKDDAGTVHWTAATNVKLEVADKATDETWVEYDARKTEDAIEAAKVEREAAARRPARWDIVVVIDEPEFVGKVFWVAADGKRMGVAREGARRVRINGKLTNKPEDVRWIDADDLCKADAYVAPVVEEAPAAVTYDEDDLGCF